MENVKINELPNHEHYPYCLTRMNEIKRFCVRLCGYTCVACGLMIVLSLVGINIGIISFLPTMLKDAFFMFSVFLQICIILLIALFSFLALKYKIFCLILMFIYIGMFISGCASKDFVSAFFTVALGLGGIIFSYKSIFVLSDFKQLSMTEGFPQFNTRLTYQTEHSEYVPYHVNRKRPSQNTMMNVTQLSESIAKTDKKTDTEYGKMDEI